MYHECIAAVTAMYLSCIMDVLDVEKVPGEKSLGRCIEDVLAHVSGMYHGCIMAVITKNLSCIMDVLEFVHYTSIAIHPNTS